MTQHSPGPWYSMTNAAHDIRDDTGEPVALVHTNGHPFPEQGKANAALVAAAPAMLEALQRVIEWIDAGCDPSDKAVSACCRAIAAATAEGN